MGEPLPPPRNPRFTPLQQLYGNDYYYSDYCTLLESMNYEILLQVDDNDYQGDSRLLLHNPDTGEYGLLIFGWGSCSGCDALQACNNLQEVEELRDSLHQSIEWYPSKQDILRRVTQRDWAGTYSGQQAETLDFVRQATAMLSCPSEPGDAVPEEEEL